MLKIPKHIAIIMDGNGRWAKQRGLPRVKGHREGAKVVEKVIEYCDQQEVKVLTLFAFGIDNLRRPEEEVNFLNRLIMEGLRKSVEKLHNNNVYFRVIGNRNNFSKKMRENIERAEALTQDNTGLALSVAINYSGHWDIAQAVQTLVQSSDNPVELTQENILAELPNHLSLSNLPLVDLLIRTSGEQRISNFMLWEIAYSELYFSDFLWPDFNKQALDEALLFFSTRERRFGMTSEQLER